MKRCQVPLFKKPGERAHFEFKKVTFIAGLWIRIHFIRIWIQKFFSMRIRIRIQVQVQLNQISRKKS